MKINNVYLAWVGMFGSVNADQFTSSYLIPSGYEVDSVYLDYPSVRVVRGKKSLILSRATGNDSFDATLEILVHDIHCLAKLTVPIELTDVGTLERELFHVPEFDKKDHLLMQVIIHIVERIFGEDNILFLENSVSLGSAEILERFSLLGINHWHKTFWVTVEGYTIIDSDGNEKQTWKKYVERKNTINAELPAEIAPIIPLLNNGFDESDIFPDIDCLGTYNDELVIHGKAGIVKHVSTTHEEMFCRNNGLKLAISILGHLEEDIYSLFEYMETEKNVSWLYVQKEYMKSVYTHQKVIKGFEDRFVNRGYPNPGKPGIRMDAPYFKNLERINHLPELRADYWSYNKRITGKLDSIQLFLVDKADKEEQKANDRLVQLIGILAALEVLFNITMVLTDIVQDNTLILLMILSLIPLFGLLMLYTRNKSRMKERRAKNLRLLLDNDKRSNQLTNFIAGMEQYANSDIIDKEYFNQAITKAKEDLQETKSVQKKTNGSA